MDTLTLAVAITAFLAGAGLSAWFVPWLCDRRAWKDGYDDGYYDGYEAADKKPLIGGSGVDLETRLGPYLSNVDPPGSHY